MRFQSRELLLAQPEQMIGHGQSPFQAPDAIRTRLIWVRHQLGSIRWLWSMLSLRSAGLPTISRERVTGKKEDRASLVENARSVRA